MTICRQWAWKPDDNMKSTKQCIQTLLQTVGGDGSVKMRQTKGTIELDVAQENRYPIAKVIELTVKGKVFEIEPVKTAAIYNSAAFGKPAKDSHRFSKGAEYAPAKARYFKLNIFRAVEGPTILEMKLFEAK